MTKTILPNESKLSEIVVYTISYKFDYYCCDRINIFCSLYRFIVKLSKFVTFSTRQGQNNHRTESRDTTLPLVVIF